MTHFVVSGHGVQIDDLDGDEPDGLDECSLPRVLSGVPVTNRTLLGICAMDYLGNPYQNADTPGLIVDDVSRFEQQFVCCRPISSPPLPLQIMHEIMVKSLPPGCHLTAIFDVRTIDNVVEHMNILTMCLHLQSCHSGTVLGSCFFNTCGLLTMTYNIQDLPHIVRQILSRPLQVV